MKQPEDIKVVATNRKATHEFLIHDRYEAGIMLVGSEVKSLRESKCTISEGWAHVDGGEVWLEGVSINEYPWANRFNHEPKRRRKLLLHKHEIEKLADRTRLRGFTLIPLSVYFKKGKVKVELGVASHKKLHDKREDKKAQDAKREIERATSRRR